jgi:uncharacterized cupredoxin-like copper-binding protein
MQFPRNLLIATASIALIATACGDTDSSDRSAAGDDVRTVEIDMVDIAFKPDTLEVEQGETVRFVFSNRGEVVHDAFIGNADAQADHEAEMREADENDDDGHDGGHDEDNSDAVAVDPGDEAELTHTFDDTGTIEVGCHQPGHYDDGMKITVDVA